MRNSATSLSRAKGCPFLLSWMLTGLAAVFFVNTAEALDPNRVMSQYQDDRWGLERGFPVSAVYAMAQSSDGYLWIGTETGLVRFDGLNFVSFERVNANSASLGPVLGLVADAEANLWIQSERLGLLRYRNGTFQNVFPEDERREEARGGVMCRGRDGTALFAGNIRNAVRYRAGVFEPLAFGAPSALVISMAEGHEGDVWLGTRDAGLVCLKDGQFLNVVHGLPDRKINCILPIGGKEVWIGTDNGVVRWTGAEVTHAGVPDVLNHAQALAIARDRESNIWVGTARGLYRINSRGVLCPEKRDPAVTALFEDREGDLWVGGAQGIARLRDTAFLSYSSSNGLPSDSNGAMYADEEGRTWFARSEGGLYRLKGSQVEGIEIAGLDSDVVYSIAGGAGEVWAGRQRGGLTRLRYRGGRLTANTYTASDGLAQNSVYAVHRSHDGTVWAGTLSGGVSRLRNGTFATYTVANGLASNTVEAIEEAADGTMYFATPNGLSALSGDRWRSYTGSDGLPPANVNCLLEDSNAVLWIGTAKGLAFLSSGRVQVPGEMPEALYEEIFGIAEDKRGYLWIAAAHRIVRVKREALLRGEFTEQDVREYGPADGLLGTEVVKRHRSVVADSMGRIWFSMDRGISVVDPTELAKNSVPALVHIEGASADGRPLGMQAPVRIPPERQRVTFRYAGVSLSAPERVKFRYMLDGFDHGWSEPVSTPEAAYTNLSPGQYRLRVVASNADGVWNSEEATIGFEMEPAYWQTWWFRMGSVIALLLGALGLFRYRMHHMTRQLKVRFEERLAERTRIAQELHDTLLQGFLSASMQLHVAAESLPADSPGKRGLNHVIELMHQVIDEGRNAVRGLRTAQSGSLDLEAAFSRVQQELGAEGAMAFRVIVDGRPRQLHPVLRDEVYRIGREALSNAFRHAHAKSIELELEYRAHQLRMFVRDNGGGIDPVVLVSGRDGHWGLSGMRERADRIGARLNVWSSAAAGTEIELFVPGHIAFQREPSRGPRKWFMRWLPRRRRASVETVLTERPK